MWTIQFYFRQTVWFLDQLSAYFSIQFGRCVLISFLALGIVPTLRGTVLKNRIFLKGMLWSIFLPVLFVGKMKLFYGVLMGRLFMWWNNGCIKYAAVRYGYMLGMVVSGLLIFRQRRKSCKEISRMETTTLCGSEIHLNEIPVTPYAVGIFHAKIVIPKVIAERFEIGEIQTILLHEQVHIQLGHLVFYFLWDILRILLWPNLLLTYCMKYFRGDMEDICDRVTIRKSGGDAYEYGQALLKSIKLLRAEKKGVPATLVGENDYRDLKNRFTKIAAYRPYRKCEAAILCAGCLAFLSVVFMLIWEVSYPRYMAENICLENEEKEIFILPESDDLKQAFHTDGQYAYLDKTAFDNVLRENGVDEDIDCFWLGFGGYTKLPGIGGNINMIYVDYSGTETEFVIPYVDREDFFLEYVYKYIW